MSIYRQFYELIYTLPNDGKGNKMLTSLFRKTIQVFLNKQTYLNLAYLGLNSAFGFAYYLTLQVCVLLAWGFIFPNVSIITLTSLGWVSQIKLALVVLSGVLIIPILVWVFQLMVMPEQWLANLLLKENILMDREMWSKDSLLLKPGRLFLAPSTWKRLLYLLLKIPLGGISFFAIFNILIPVIALFGMPLAYLVGFRDLIIGAWRFDSIGKSALAFVVGALLLPVSLYAMNLLAKFSGWLARNLLSVTGTSGVVNSRRSPGLLDTLK